METEGLEFEWDPAKDVTNEQKHRISFKDARLVFRDPHLLIENVTKPEHGEQRSKAIGRVGAFVVAVIFTNRQERRRIISARRARRDEREHYRQGAESA